MFLNQAQCGECGCCVKGSGWLWWAMIVFAGYRVSGHKPWVQEYRVSSNKPSCPQWGSSATNTVWMRSNSSNNPAHSHYAAPHWILELQTKVREDFLVESGKVHTSAFVKLRHSGKGQARIGKGWPSRRKASKLKPLPRAYTKVGRHLPTHRKSH